MYIIVCSFVLFLLVVVLSVFLRVLYIIVCPFVLFLLVVVLSVFLPVLYIIVCPFVLFLLVVVLSVFLRVLYIIVCPCFSSSRCIYLIYDILLSLLYFQTFLYPILSQLILG